MGCAVALERGRKVQKSAWQWMVTPLQNYANFSGRAPRSEYWWFILMQVVVSLIPIVGALATLVFFIPSLAVSVRRLHDIGRSGWWYLLPVGALIAWVALILTSSGASALASGEFYNAAVGGVALIGLLGVGAVYLLMLVWFCTAGQPFSNKWGPDPYGPQDVAADFS
jgi:uncharacterized membrane protein YhaH (DUF805 family)